MVQRLTQKKGSRRFMVSTLAFNSLVIGKLKETSALERLQSE